MQTRLELYQLVTPLAHLGIWERKLPDGEVYWNAVVREILEVDADFVPARHPEIGFFIDMGAIQLLINYAQQSGEPQEGKFQIRTAKDNLKWVRVRIRASFEGGSCRSIYGTIEDITEDILLVKKLRESEEQFHQSFDYAPIGMALVSLTGQWIRVNRTLCNLLGYEAQDLLKSTSQALTHPEDLENDLAFVQQLIDGTLTTYHLEKRYFHKNGAIIWALLYVTLVKDDSGEPLYFVSQIKDITERKKTEFEKAKTLEIISAQNRRLLNFAHIVSHNLRSHTGNIQMITDMIGKEQDPFEKDHLVSMLGINAANLQETLLHLNEVVDVHAHGKQSLKQINLLAEIHKIVDLLEISLRQADATVDVQIPTEITLDYDQAYLESILLNLLTNAIKYREKSRPLIIAITAYSLRNTVILSIEDNGVGIDLSLHGHKLFGMYKTFYGNADARGIGLFLVKNQVEVMGGQITAESTIGVGTKFRIEF